MKFENEYKSHIRSVIDQEDNGWQLLASNITKSCKVYPFIYQTRKQLDSED